MSILILGAGIAGLSAARELARHGVDCVILEARDRVGGRIWTVADPGRPGPIELGAEFVHGHPEATLALIREAGVSRYELPDRHLLLTRHGKIRDVPEFWARMDRLIGEAPRGPRDRSFAGQLRRKWARPSDKNLARSFVEGFHAADPNLISQKALARETRAAEEIEADRSFRILGGYGALTEAMLNDLRPNRVKIVLESPVSELAWEPGLAQVTIFGPSPRTYSARSVIITVPPGPLREIRFEPRIPEKEDTLKFMRTGEVMKLIIRFRDNFWDARLKTPLSFIHTNDRLFPTWWSAAPFDWPILTGWTGAGGARELSGLSESDLRETAVASLARIFKKSSRSITDLIETVHFHDWQSDPFSQGAYGYLTVGGLGAPSRLAHPIAETLFFAGEATEGAGLGGTVDGAISSGIRAARQVVQSNPSLAVHPRQRRQDRLRLRR